MTWGPLQSESGCAGTFDNECDGYNGGGAIIGGCGISRDEYECYNTERVVSETGCVSNFDDECDEWNGGGVRTGSCGWFKDEYECYSITTVVSETGCVDDFDNECDEWNGGGVRTGSCGWSKEEYECYSIETVETDCLENPVCPSGYTQVDKRSCVPPCEDECSPVDSHRYSCYEEDKKIWEETCGDFDADNCLEWGGGKNYKSCGNALQCEEGNSECVPGAASLSLTFDLTSRYYDDPYWKYIYTRTFEETNGVGVTLTEGQACYQSTGSCNPKVTVNYRIEGTDSLVHANNEVDPKSRTIFS